MHLLSQSRKLNNRGEGEGGGSLISAERLEKFFEKKLAGGRLLGTQEHGERIMLICSLVFRESKKAK